MIIDDARSLPAAAQEEKRKQAVRLRKQGYSYHEIADKVGVHNLTVGKWIRAYEAQGFSGIKSKPADESPVRDSD
nr:helix-turn-helix domain-containing protein [Hahella sp. KA22]